MAFKIASRPGNSEDSTTNYPKRYWWLILVVVPLVGALIQYQPWKRPPGASGAAGISGNQFLGPAIVGNVSLVVNEAAKTGTVLDPRIVETLKNAAELSKAGDHDAAVGKIEYIRATSGGLATLPSLLNNLGLEYLSGGRPDQARKAFEDALKKDPENKTAWAGLGQLPDSHLNPVTVVNFSSQYTPYAGGASSIVDGDPATGWRSGDGKFPQSFVLQLPVESTISELNFNNVTHGDSNEGARDIEISTSTQSATSGFQIVAKAVLTKGEIGQNAMVRPTPGRWIKLRVLSNYGNPDFTQLGDVDVIGRPRVQ